MLVAINYFRATAVAFNISVFFINIPAFLLPLVQFFEPIHTAFVINNCDYLLDFLFNID